MTAMTASDSPSVSAAHPGVSKVSVAAAVAGNVLEFYDFTTYTFFAVMIGQHFFPSKDPFISLILSIATFGVGFVTRPIGGIVIGALADRAGRKPAMMLTVALMAVGMLVIALTPSYATIGPIAPILVVFARLVQGFALGGEVGPASSFLIEASPPHQRGLYASWQLASQGLSAFIAGGLGLGLSLSLPDQAMQDWGWRIPFLVGVSIIPVALFMRSKLPETLDLSAPTTHHSLGAVLGSLFTAHARPVVLALLVISSGTIATYILNYMTTYAITTLHMAQGISIAATLVLGLCTFAFSLLGGWLSDLVGRKPLLVLPRVIFTIAAYPAFMLMNAFKNAPTLLIVTGLLASIGALGGAVSLVIIPESLPKSVRSSGFAVAYALAVTVFGGTAQLVVTWLIRVTGDPLSPAWYLIASGIVGIAAMMMMKETRGLELED
jgi:MFS family permease